MWGREDAPPPQKTPKTMAPPKRAGEMGQVGKLGEKKKKRVDRRRCVES